MRVLVGLALKVGVIGRSADGQLVYEGEPLGLSREDAEAFLRCNPDIAGRIEAATQQAFMPGGCRERPHQKPEVPALRRRG
jgi:hypothetical protein